MHKIAVCIPTVGAPTWGLFDSFGPFQAYHYLEHPEIGITVIRPPRPLPIDVARNYLAQQAIDGGFDALWFVDQDCKFNPHTLERLMRWDKDVVGALCMIRGDWIRPMVFRGRREPDSEFWKIAIDDVYNFMRLYGNVQTNEPQDIEAPENECLFEADFTGCHCLLIKTDVLRKMEWPWFSGIPGQEDRYFCLKAKELGIPVYVDFGTFVGHLTGERSLGVMDFMAHYLLTAALVEEGDSVQNQ